MRVFLQRAAEIKRLKQQNQELARARETSALAHGKNMSNHERAVAERKYKQQQDLQVQLTANPFSRCTSISHVFQVVCPQNATIE